MPKVVAEYREEARMRIIKAAEKVFAKKGYHKATMDDIGKEIGVSKGALYQYFSSKEELFKAIAEKWQHNLITILLNSLEKEKATKPHEKLIDTVLKDSKNEMGFNFELISQASRDPSLGKLLTETYNEVIKILTAYLEKKKANGSIANHTDTHSQSIALIALTIGLMGCFILGVDKAEVRQIWIKATQHLALL